MTVLIKIGIATVLPVVLLSGMVIAGVGVYQESASSSPGMSSIDESELLEFDENGVVINLGYPNVFDDVASEVILSYQEAQLALQSVMKVLPRLTDGKNVAFVHHMPINKRTSSHIAAGAFFRDPQEETSFAPAKEKSIDPMLQLGVTYKLTSGLFVTAEVQRYFISEDDDLNRYAVGMVYNF